MAVLVLADTAVTISELKRSPTNALDSGNGRPVAIMNQTIPAHHAVPAALYEKMLGLIDDTALNRLCDERASERRIAIGLDELCA